jgi:ribosomal protein S18 acetylase RimI-like enzyme
LQAPDAYGSTYARELGFGDDVWRDRLHPGANPHFAVVDPADELMGLAVGAPDDDDPDAAFVVGVWVAPEVRGGGALPMLMAQVEAWAIGQRRTVLRLHVTEGNERAERAYRRLGFVRTGDFEVRERDGAREFEMVKPLEAP